MAAQAIQPFYELKLWVAEESGLRETYTDAIMKHNKVSIPCIYDSHMGEFDAGFDLFCPAETLVGGRTTVKMNHLVKCAMDMYAPGEWSGGKPVGQQNDPTNCKYSAQNHFCRQFGLDAQYRYRAPPK